MFQRLSTFQRWVLVLFLLQFIPYILLWDDSYVRIHDTLEGEWIWYQILFESGELFNFSKDALVEQVMNGLPRQAYHTGLSFHVIWIGLFGLYGGYVFNYFLTHLIAFLAMILLLRTHFLKRADQQDIVWGVALCFAWVPFYSAFGLTVAGQPLVLWAAMNILSGNKKWFSYALILAFPLYSSLVWIAPPMLIGFGCMWLYRVIRHREWHIDFVILLMGLVISFLLVNWPLLSLTLMPGDFVSHRESYDYFFDKTLGIGTSLLDATMLFTITHYHVGTMVSLIMLIAFLVSRYHRRLESDLSTLLISMILGICLFFGFYHWLVYFFGDWLSLLYTFKFDRVSIIIPFLWMLLFSFSLSRIWSRPASRRLVYVFLIGQCLVNMAANDEFQHNLRHLVSQPTKPNFKQFKAADLFEEIQEYIGLPADEYRVISLGINPSVSQINGFYTLDGLQSVYDGNYKKQFREIISGELEKSEVLREYFDSWGNRCYLFSADLGWRDNAFMIGKDSEQTIDNLQFGTDAFFNIGGRFIISSLPIGNHLDLNLQLEKIFDHPDSNWSIHLYRVDETK